MNHAALDDHHLAERYLMGKLSADEAASFEEHYLSCPQCLDRLALAESMQRGFRRAAGQDVARLAVTRQLALVAWLARLSRSRQLAALAAALLVAVLLPGGLALYQLGERDRELAAVRSTLTQERQQLLGELEASRLDLVREQQNRARTAEELARSRAPQGNVPILFLDAERGSGAGEPTARLRLPPLSGWVVLALQVAAPHAPSYRVTLRDAQGREVWRGENFQVNDLETLSLTVPATLLQPGDYLLVAEGSARPGAATRFAFRVLPER